VATGNASHIAFLFHSFFGASSFWDTNWRAVPLPELGCFLIVPSINWEALSRYLVGSVTSASENRTNDVFNRLEFFQIVQCINRRQMF
jgi:hypothetical protein